ncbi:TPA: hypothetical protein ONA53_001868 [Pseudomonas aeruginosa]|uniref:hypothetical protein n=1 Tax=Pseudomonas aeruginosa TaxID=287 RepID=UPI000FF7920F|nr:hypothetical protein [Pseudomonas aeruginosa]RPS20633.1 hypothetical protein IPC1027_21550 [Pseudomonas aeruginosa]HCR1517469.1 hypothetical protein [Pseudomonas aeruginosa]
MLRLIIFAVLGLTFYLGRFKSDWLYAMFDQDMSADPDRIFGLLATMGICALFLLILMFVAGCMAVSQRSAVDQEQ